MCVLSSKYQLKLILIGDGGVGKTSLVQQFIHSRFAHDYQMTIGVDISAKTVDLGDYKVQLTIHDIGGQDKFAPLRGTFYKGVNIAMAVYDITRKESLFSLKNKWLPELREFSPASQDPEKDVKIAFIGNKADLKKLHSITEKEGQGLADSFNAVTHIWTSAKENMNVDDSFSHLARLYLKDEKGVDS